MKRGAKGSVWGVRACTLLAAGVAAWSPLTLSAGERALGLAANAGLAELAQPQVLDFPSPLVQVDAHPGLHGVALQLDLGLVEMMHDAERVIVRDFLLEGGVGVDLELEPFRIFSPNVQRVIVDEDGQEHMTIGGEPEVMLFRGTVIGAKDSTVFLAMGPHGANGFLDFNGHVHVLASAPYGSDLPHAIYNLTAMPDGVIVWQNFVCGLDQLVGEAQQQIDDENWTGDVLKDGTCRVIDIAIDSDWIYTRDLFGSNPVAAEAYIATLMGAVSEIYTRDVSTGFSVVFTRTFGSNTSPYNSNDIFQALSTVQATFRTQFASLERHLVHLFSGRRYSGAAGVAYLSAVCNFDIGYGVSGYLNGSFPYPLQAHSPQNWDVIVVAHELGHNAGTGHTHDSYTPVIDNCGNGNCAGAFGGCIMSYCHTCPGGTNNIKLEFHPRVRDRIAGYLTGLAMSGACPNGFEVIPPVITGHPEDQSTPIGFNASFSVDVEQSGAQVQYRWRRNGSAIPGGDTPTLNIIAAQPSDAGVYDCQVITQCGQTISLPATLTVTGTDCNGSGVDDAYEILMGIEEDCNNNGLPDSCDLVERVVDLASPRYEPLDWFHPHNLDLGYVTEATTDVVITARARAKLGSTTERVGVRINGQLLGWLYQNNGTNCNVGVDVDSIVIPMSTFNAAFSPGPLTIQFAPTANVSPNVCPKPSFLEVTVSFTAAPFSTDSTGDGVPDDCTEVTACSSADITGAALDGVPDGSVDAFDLNYYLGLWMTLDPAADRTGPALDGIPDGQVNSFDLNHYIDAWLAGCD